MLDHVLCVYPKHLYILDNVYFSRYDLISFTDLRSKDKVTEWQIYFTSKLFPFHVSNDQNKNRHKSDDM